MEKLLLGLEDCLIKGVVNLIPKKIQPYFKTLNQIKDGGNDIIEGVLTCCKSHDFEVFVAGEIKHSTFSRMCPFSENNKITIEVRCRKCGQVISVFDSDSDGYDKCGEKQHSHMPMEPVKCRKCQNGGFSVGVKYEYPDSKELKELEIPEIDNAFTWIWITLECNKCKTRYKNFVDCETS